MLAGEYLLPGPLALQTSLVFRANGLKHPGNIGLFYSLVHSMDHDHKDGSAKVCRNIGLYLVGGNDSKCKEA